MIVEEDTSTSEFSTPVKFYNPGSTISLTCLVRRYLIKNATVTEMTNLTWKKDETVLDVDQDERMREVIFERIYLTETISILSQGGSIGNRKLCYQ